MGLLYLIETKINPKESFYDYIYFFGGINNLSEKHNSGRVTAVYDDTGHLVDHMFSQLFLVRNALFKFSYRPVICQLKGY